MGTPAQLEDQQSFKKLLVRLTPATANNEQCVNFIKNYDGDLSIMITTLLDEIKRSSLNGRVKILNLLEYCAGIVGKCEAPESWNLLVAQNLQKFIDAAVPIQFAPPSLVNVEPARRFVRGFRNAGLIEPEVAKRIIEQIDEKQKTIESLAASRQGKYFHQITREEVLRRMEDDRERAKKYKERELSVNIGSKEEFNRLWSTVATVTSSDLATAKEFNMLADL